MSTSHSQNDTETVFSFRVFDLDALEMRMGLCKATRERIEAMRHAEILLWTAEDVPIDAVDSCGCFHRVATGWGELS